MGEGLKKKLVGGFAVLAVGCLAYIAFWDERSSVSTHSADHRILQDINTGKNYQVNITADDYPPYPHKNRSTGEMTLYPTEVCYWDEFGEKGGTRVILNTWRKLPEPTQCPVCGHTVRVHNPRPPAYQDDK